ncbi:MAG: hypothetical protein HUU38_16335 [Anaerolineales bacterium]|nr:hypothetical protein [Anaerolineales bacterium]
MQVVYRSPDAHCHALAAKQVVFGEGGGRSPAFFGGRVVYVVSGGDAEGVGVVGLAGIDEGASGRRVRNDCGTGCCPVDADLERLRRKAGASLKNLPPTMNRGKGTWSV